LTKVSFLREMRSHWITVVDFLIALAKFEPLRGGLCASFLCYPAPQKLYMRWGLEKSWWPFHTSVTSHRRRGLKPIISTSDIKATLRSEEVHRAVTSHQHSAHSLYRIDEPGRFGCFLRAKSPESLLYGMDGPCHGGRTLDTGNGSPRRWNR